MPWNKIKKTKKYADWGKNAAQALQSSWPTQTTPIDISNINESTWDNYSKLEKAFLQVSTYSFSFSLIYYCTLIIKFFLSNVFLIYKYYYY